LTPPGHTRCARTNVRERDVRQNWDTCLTGLCQPGVSYQSPFSLLSWLVPPRLESTTLITRPSYLRERNRTGHWRDCTRVVRLVAGLNDWFEWLENRSTTEEEINFARDASDPDVCIGISRAASPLNPYSFRRYSNIQCDHRLIDCRYHIIYKCTIIIRGQ